MHDFHYHNRLKGHFQDALGDKASEIAELFGDWLSSGLSLDPVVLSPDSVSEFSDLMAQDLDFLKSGRFGQRNAFLISKRMLDALRQSRRVLDEGFLFDAFARPNTDLPFEIARRVGLFTRSAKDGRFRFGYDTAGREFTLPTTAIEAIHNAIPLMWPTPYLDTYQSEIETLKETDKPAVDQSNSNSSDSEALAEIDLLAASHQLHKYFEDVVNAAKQKASTWFVGMQNAVDFYIRIQALYSKEAAVWPDVYVFSTTSGLVVKEQYLGSTSQRTSVFRRPYFEMIRSSGARIFYQMDPQTTWKKGILRSKRSLEEHQNHLASFLQIPNLELSEIPFDTPENRWRREYTIVTSRGQVAFSSRSPEVKEICEGLIADKEFWNTQKMSPADAVGALYSQQLDSIAVIKKCGEKLSHAEANDRARDSFLRWKKTFGE